MIFGKRDKQVDSETIQYRIMSGILTASLQIARREAQELRGKGHIEEAEKAEALAEYASAILDRNDTRLYEVHSAIYKPPVIVDAKT